MTSHLSMRVRALATLGLLVPLGMSVTAQPAELDTLISSLENPASAWAATARIRTAPAEIVPALLASRAPLERPHGGLAPRGLALAKRGPSVIPAIETRLRALRGATDRESRDDAFGLVEVLAALGADGVPALVGVAEQTDDPAIRRSALRALVTMDSEARAFDHIGSPWTTWHPAGDTLQAASALTRVLPRVELLLRREPRAAGGYSSSRETAWLLARWGDGETRANGLGALTSIAADTAGDGDWTAAVWLWRLGSPVAARILDEYAASLRHHRLRHDAQLRVAVVLQHMGDAGSTRWFGEVLRHGDTRLLGEAFEAIRSCGAVAMIPALIARLDDRAPSGRTRVVRSDDRVAQEPATVGHLALDALRGLTFQDLPLDRTAWETWFADHARTSRAEWLRQWVAARVPEMTAADPADVELWMRWIAELPVADVLPLVDGYLSRPEARAGSSVVSGGISAGGRSLFQGASIPPVVTLLLRGAQAGVPGYRDRLVRSLDASDARVRLRGALALGAFDRPRATDALARQASETSSPYTRFDAARYLLFMGDARGIPVLLDLIDESGDRDVGGPQRLRACEHLRWFTQQPLPCAVDLPAAERAPAVAQWRNWWRSVPKPFVVPLREARLDDEARFHVPAVRRASGPPVD